MTKSAYSMESASFQDHSDDLHGEKTGNLHGESADLHGQQRGDLHGQREDLHGTTNSTEFLKQSFSTIFRSKSVASISNDTDSRGQNQDPHHNSIDDITVKVDNGAEGTSFL